MTKTKNKDNMSGNDSKKRIIMIVGGVFALIGIIIYMFTGSSSDQKVASDIRTKKIEANTGSPIQSEDSDYTKQVVISNENEAQRAMKSDSSHLDIQTNELEELVDDNEFLGINEEEHENDEKVSQETQEVKEVVVETPIYINNTIIKEVAVPELKPYNYLEDYSLASMFSQQLVNKEFNQSNISNLAKREVLKKEADEKARQETEINKNKELQDKKIAGTKTVYKVGDLVPAILETKIISTQQTPVRVRISSGPFKGGIVTGVFDKGSDGVLIRLTTLNHSLLENSIPINAVALDFNKASTSIASSVNRHIPERILMTFASSFAKGYADAMSDNNTTSEQVIEGAVGTTTRTDRTKKTVKEINKEAGSGAISSTADMINNAMPTEPTIRVKANTEIGLYFMSDLVINESNIVKD